MVTNYQIARTESGHDPPQRTCSGSHASHASGWITEGLSGQGRQLQRNKST